MLQAKAGPADSDQKSFPTDGHLVASSSLGITATIQTNIPSLNNSLAQVSKRSPHLPLWERKSGPVAKACPQDLGWIPRSTVDFLGDLGRHLVALWFRSPPIHWNDG